jgi:peroxiredoxin
MTKVKITVGQPAPDSTLGMLNGESIALSSLWRAGNNVLLLFLRHLG